jgi:hypothetical protein
MILYGQQLRIRAEPVPFLESKSINRQLQSCAPLNFCETVNLVTFSSPSTMTLKLPAVFTVTGYPLISLSAVRAFLSHALILLILPFFQASLMGLDCNSESRSLSGTSVILADRAVAIHAFAASKSPLTPFRPARTCPIALPVGMFNMTSAYLALFSSVLAIHEKWACRPRFHNLSTCSSRSGLLGAPSANSFCSSILRIERL